MLPNHSKQVTNTLCIYVFVVSVVSVFAEHDLCSIFKNCDCYKQNVLRCPSSEPKVSVEVIRDEILISCEEGSQFDLDTFGVHFGRLEGLNFKTILDKFSITHLEKLRIEHCSVGDKLSQGAPFFEEITSLKFLTFASFSRIPANFIKNFPNLISLHLENNNTANIGYNFEKNPKLQILNLRRNNLKNLPNGVFKNLASLKMLNLSSNQFSHVAHDYFEGLTNLQIFDLSSNSINYIEENAFSHLNKLEFVKLQSNQLGNISSNIFKQNRNLKNISINHNSNLVIFDYTFANLTNLESVNIGYSHLKDILEHTFENCSSLTDLDLQHNEIKYLPSNLFKTLTKLRDLNLSFNKLVFLPQNFFSSLKNAFSSERDFRQLLQRTLKLNESFGFGVRIDLSHNNISYINFGNKLHLAQHNQENIGKVSGHTKIDITGNPLACDCKNLDLINSVRNNLYLDLMTLTEIIVKDTKCSQPTDFRHIAVKDLHPKLITCGRNDSCPPECRCFDRPYDSEIVVDCSFRNLTSFPPLLLQSIKERKIEVNMTGNLLESGPSENRGYEMVKILLLSHNKLKTFDWSPPTIEELRLDHNNLKSLTADVLETFHSSIKISKLSLGNNSWSCDCSALDLQNFAKQNYQKIIDSNNIFCDGENTHINNKVITCKSKMNIQIVVPVMSLFLLTIIVIPSYFIYKQEIKIWLFSKKLCMWFVTEEELDKDKKYDIFLNFSHKDENFVAQNLILTLEKSFKLCIHYKDWVPDDFICNQIADSVYNSRRTLVVLSNNFLEGPWGNFQFIMAQIQSIEQGKPKLIVIKFGDLDMDKISDDIKVYMKTNTYVEWGKPWFWEKLLYALPHKQREYYQDEEQTSTNMMLK